MAVSLSCTETTVPASTSLSCATDWLVTRMLPELEVWEDASGVIQCPERVLWTSSPDGPQSFSNEFGCYYYHSWIAPKKTALYI